MLGNYKWYIKKLRGLPKKGLTIKKLRGLV